VKISIKFKNTPHILTTFKPEDIVWPRTEENLAAKSLCKKAAVKKYRRYSR
jgi:hypothetical protein